MSGAVDPPAVLHALNKSLSLFASGVCAARLCAGSVHNLECQLS
jgi:hypothetical protein